MNDLQVGLIVSAATSLGAVFGYLAKRFIEGSGPGEKLTRMNVALEIKRKMIEGNLTPEDVDRMVKELMPRWPWRRRKNDVEEDGGESYEAQLMRSRSTALAELAAGDPPNFGDGPQIVMNMQQGERLERATAIMDRTLAELEGIIEDNPSHVKKLNAAQAAWKKYRDAQASFASLTFEGGTMQPLIHSGAATALTIERIVELRMDIHERDGYDAWRD